MRIGRWWTVKVGAVALALMLVLGLAGGVLAQDKPAEKPAEASTVAAKPAADPIQVLTGKTDDLKVALATVWVLAAAFLVFFMNLGFATVESGFCRAKNTVAILAKNFIVFAAASIAFLVLGFG